MHITDAPFKVLVIAPFQMSPEADWVQSPIPVDSAELDHAVSSLSTQCRIGMPRTLCPAGAIELRVERLKDFHPDTLARKNPFLSHALAAGEVLSNRRLSADEKRAFLEQWPDLPKFPVDEVPAAGAQTEGGSRLDHILKMVAMPDARTGTPTRDSENRGAVSEILSAVLSRIYHSPAFRASEAAWRGVKLLLQQAEPAGPSIRVGLVPATLETLEETLSHLLIGQVKDPPGLVLVDHAFDQTPRSLRLLEKVAQFAETLMAPTLVWASPRMLALDSWAELEALPFLPHYLEAPHFAKLNRLKALPETGWIGLAINRCLLRYPYGPENPPRYVWFEEAEPPWTGPVWPIAALILKSLQKTGWPTRFTQWQAFQIENLPLYLMDSGVPAAAEALISEDRMDQFRRAGLMPLAAAANRDAVFAPVETTLGGASLAYQLFAARLTHFLLGLKDRLPSGLTGKLLEEAVKNGIALFWEKTGHPIPDSLVVKAGTPDENAHVSLRLELAPPRSILPLGGKLQLELRW
jgi:type VI secretion system protein ImpC